MGGKRKSDIISVYISPDIKRLLEKWAQQEERSVSWIAAKLIEKGVRERQQQTLDEERQED